MGPKPILLAGRLVRLEPLTPGHAPGLFEALAADPSVWRWLPMPPPETVAEMEAQIADDLDMQARGELVPFTQLEQPTGRSVGRTNYMNISRRDRGLEIGGTWLGRPWHRTGLNTEAKYLLLRHAFEELGAVGVQLKTDARNVQSQTAIARLGAVREGVLRKHMLTQHGVIRNTVMFSITDDEWPAVKARLDGLLAAHG
jgi:RimJ/RimL family protein N-acetyltransferase